MPALERIRRWVADLAPASAAMVMATAILSTGLDLFGWRIVSEVFFVVAVFGAVVLAVAYGWRAIAYPGRLAADARDPGKGFGYFTLVAAPNVVGMRLALDHREAAAVVLGLTGAALWLVLTYAIPGTLIMGERGVAPLPRTDGSWFLWVVGTQALAGSAATLAATEHRHMGWLVPLAVVLWGIGAVLYLMLVGVVTVSLLERVVTPHALSPTYWVYMGATAITVQAAAKILAVRAAVPVLTVTREVVSGVAFLLWAFGTWWIPMLLVFAIWRHVVRRSPVGYEPAMWSMVFPLGMYAAASADYGRATGLGFMVTIGRVSVWAGVAAWLAVGALMVAPLVSRRSAKA
ncbi:MAG TPA: tellurite resistance/C4-dicarboxylate transporter family protein [Amycolatopsis sp.]|nr:tellurite resistance/C4-dicarboxylate transporter family protein [Amycolatopsis sp.]